MKRLIATVGLLLMVSASALAQNADNLSHGQGYVFIGPAVGPSILWKETAVGVNAGFGGEVFVYRGLGVGTECGYASPKTSFNGDEAVGSTSFNASYHSYDFRKKDRRGVEPFVTGGYSLYWGDRRATQNGFNLGGGANIWLAKHAAVRLEIRGQGNVNHFHDSFAYFVAFRIGVTFR